MGQEMNAMAHDALKLTVTPEPRPVGSSKSQAMRAGPMAAEKVGTQGSFGDILDIANPLQHIPIVSNIYRALTGDAISTPARIIGGTLFGGPIGFFSSLFSSLFSNTIGADIASRQAAGTVAAAQAQGVSSYQTAQQLGASGPAYDTRA